MRAVIGMAVGIATFVTACGVAVPSVAPSRSAPPAQTPTELPTWSADVASRWQRIELSGAVPVGPLSDVLAIDDGFLVSGVAGQGGRQGPVVLHSIDGVDWTPEPISSGLSAYPSSLTAVGDRVIGVGAAETGRCAHPFAIDTWARSPAGTWREAPWADQLCAGREFASVVLSSDGIHLVGTGNGDAPLSWTSPDGVNWTNDRPDVGEFAARTAVADGDEVLVFGLNGSGPPGLVATTDGHAFAARPFAVVPADGFPLALIWDASGLQAFLASGERLLVVTRDPTGTWTSAIASGVRGDLIASITTVDGGLVALGGDDARPVLGWTSADGHTWQSLGLPIAGPGAGVSDVATHDGVAVIVGTTDSPDGLETFGTIWSGSSELLGLPH